MSQKPDARIELPNFPGIVLAGDPNDIPAGAAQMQINLSSHIAGELNVRRGYRLITFENSTGVSGGGSGDTFGSVP